MVLVLLFLFLATLHFFHSLPHLTSSTHKKEKRIGLLKEGMKVIYKKEIKSNTFGFIFTLCEGARRRRRKRGRRDSIQS